MTRKLVKSGRIVSLLAFFSRVLSIYKEMCVARLLGASGAADLFVVADRVPRLLYGFIVDGLCVQAWLPVLAEYYYRKKFTHVGSMIIGSMGVLAIGMGLLCLTGILGATVIVAIFCPGWCWDAWMHPAAAAHPYWQAVQLMRLSLLCLFFTVLAGVISSVLTLYRQFLNSASTALMVNVGLIAVAFRASNAKSPVQMLMTGLVGSAGLALMYQLWCLSRIGHSLRGIYWGWSHPGLLKVRRALPVVLMSTGILQFNKFLSTQVSSFLELGALSWLHYAQRVAELPAGVLSVAITTILLPAFSKCYQKERHDVTHPPLRFSATLEWGIRMVVLYGLPALVVVGLLARPLLATLFFGGAFNEVALEKTAQALQVYSVGCLWCTFSILFSVSYYARQQAAEPLRCSMFSGVLDASVTLLALKCGYLAVAWAYVLSNVLKSLLLYRSLTRHGFLRPSPSLWRFILKISVAALVMGVVAYLGVPEVTWWCGVSTWIRIGALSALCFLMSGIYIAILWLLRVNLMTTLHPARLRKK